MGVADFNENITDLINVYNSNYQSTYPYYAITLDVKTDNENNKKMYFYLWVFKEKPKLKWYISSIQGGVGVPPYNWVYLYLRASATDGVISKSYSFTQYYKDEFDYSSELQFIEGAWILDKILAFSNNADVFNPNYYNPYQFYYANFDLQVSDITKASYYEDDKSRYSLGYSNYLIPKIDSPGVYNVIARNRLNYMVFEPYYKYDKDLTEHIGYENGMIICIESYFKQEPTRLMVETLEASVVWELPRVEVEKLIDQYHDIERLYRSFIEHSLIESQVKADTLRFEPAHERYNRLLQLHPEILKRAPLVYIASLLQMTPETLSRVRSSLL